MREDAAQAHRRLLTSQRDGDIRVGAKRASPRTSESEAATATGADVGQPPRGVRDQKIACCERANLVASLTRTIVDLSNVVQSFSTGVALRTLQS